MRILSAPRRLAVIRSSNIVTFRGFTYSRRIYPSKFSFGLLMFDMYFFLLYLAGSFLRRYLDRPEREDSMCYKNMILR